MMAAISADLSAVKIANYAIEASAWIKKYRSWRKKVTLIS